MWLPEWMYEGLPVLYIAGGAASLAVFGHSSVGRMSAVLLFLATLIVGYWRRAARKPFEPDVRERTSWRWTLRTSRGRA